MGKIKNMEQTLKKYKDAELTFKYQIIFDTREKRERHLNDLPKDLNNDLSFLGKIKEDEIAIKTADGTLNPMTLQKFEYDIN
jgi:hypothetical protein